MRLWGRLLLTALLSLGAFSFAGAILDEPSTLGAAALFMFVRLGVSVVCFREFLLSWTRSSESLYLKKGASAAIALGVCVVIWRDTFSLAFYTLDVSLYVLFLLLAVAVYRNAPARFVAKHKRVVIYGAGEAGFRLLRELATTEYKVVLFVDDAPKMQKATIDGIAVASFDTFRERVETLHCDVLMVAMPSSERRVIEKVYSQVAPLVKEIRVLPSLGSLLEDVPLAGQVHDFSVEDLLARRPRDLDKGAIETFLRDKVVLITGAGGSIGSELVRQCLRYGATKVIAVDQSESDLYAIHDEVEDERLVPVMQSVLNKGQLDTVFVEFGPAIVIHAAAYKHVPLCEGNVAVAIENNINGARNVVDVAIAHGVKHLVMISSDKAVRPTSVMGATKRVCELYAQNVDAGVTNIVAVRFGNVLGSSGSVLPKFKRQIINGGPVTVTHSEVTRYFMLIPEACELVLQAGALGAGGEVFILDMGEPVRIMDLAKKMVEISRRLDIDIIETGLRPGEKLYEELLISDSAKKTEYESITVASPTAYDIEELNADIEALLSSHGDKEQLQKIVPEYIPQA
jgi:UDP-N-acetyl-D-glucosamine 4,6-dehydratase